MDAKKQQEQQQQQQQQQQAGHSRRSDGKVNILAAFFEDLFRTRNHANYVVIVQIVELFLPRKLVQKRRKFDSQSFLIFPGSRKLKMRSPGNKFPGSRNFRTWEFIPR
jgi:hypothetical protein